MSGQFVIQRAVKAKKRARIALDGPAGSGKTFTALELAVGLAEGGKIGLIDTEKSSADLYADRYEFDTIKLDYFSAQNYIGALEAFGSAGYAVVIVDSWSHAWEGEGGALEMVDEAAKRNKGNSYVAWRDVTPLHNKMVAAILDYPGHVIVTMRTKMEYALDKDDKTGKTSPRKVGMAPIQRGGVEYEFDVVVDMDLEHNFIVSKTRLSVLDGKVIKCPTRKVGVGILRDLSGMEMAPAPAPATQADVAPTPEPAVPQAEPAAEAPLPPVEAEAPPPVATPAVATPVPAPPPTPTGDNAPDAQYPVMSTKRVSALRNGFRELGWPEAQVEDLLAAVETKEDGQALVKRVQAGEQPPAPSQEAPSAASGAAVSPEDGSSRGVALLGNENAVPDASGAATVAPNPFAEDTPTPGTVQRVDDGTVAQSEPVAEEPVYHASGEPANAAAQAHSNECDANAAMLATCELLVKAFAEGDEDAIEPQYRALVAAETGTEGSQKILGFLGPANIGLDSTKRADLRDRCGFVGINWTRLEPAQRLAVAIRAEGEKAEREGAG